MKTLKGLKQEEIRSATKNYTKPKRKQVEMTSIQ